MKNVLFILDDYFPKPSANGICVSKLAKEFKEKDINVSLLCYEKNERNNLKCIEIGKREKVYYLPCAKINVKSSRVMFYLKWLFARKHLPSENKRLSDMMFSVADEIVLKDKIDTVVCVHLPIETVITGKRLKEKYPSLTVVAYMLDSLSGGALPRLLPSFFCRRKKVLWENKAFSCYDQVVLMESSRNHHERYSKSAEWYKNAHFLDVPALIENNYISRKSKERKEVVISFVGTMAEGVRTPFALLRVLCQMAKPRIRFIIAGHNRCGDLACFVKNNENIMLDIRGTVTYEEAQKIMEESDFLVNLGNVNSNLVPSKIFEYMSYGKPIISTFVNGNDSSIPYLREYPATFFIDERDGNHAKIAQLLTDFIAQNRDIFVAHSSIFKKFYNNTPVALYDFLSSKSKI